MNLHSLYYQKVGKVDRGDTLGEEGLFEAGGAVRRETAIAQGDSFVVELLKENVDRLDMEMQGTDEALDWFTFVSKLKTQWMTKRIWR